MIGEPNDCNRYGSVISKYIFRHIPHVKIFAKAFKLKPSISFLIVRERGLGCERRRGTNWFCAVLPAK